MMMIDLVLGAPRRFAAGRAALGSLALGAAHLPPRAAARRIPSASAFWGQDPKQLIARSPFGH